MFIDTHTHLYLSAFSNGGKNAVERALAAEVQHMILPNVDLSTIEPMRKLHSEFPQATSMAMGLHPTEIGEDWRDALSRTKEEFDTNRSDYIAVGEIGIDMYWDKTFIEQQMQAFEAQVQWAVDTNLPIIVHCREGLAQTLEVLQAFPQARGVMHSFGGTIADVDAVRRVVDFYFGINGVVTFKNSGLRNTIPVIGTDRLLLETDSPYLAPVPLRGKRNESAHITHIAKHIAETLGYTQQIIAESTTANAHSLFAI